MTMESERDGLSVAKVLPGRRLGMVGGGQLGRMFVMAAARMGYEVVVFSPYVDDPAAQLAHDRVAGSLDDAKAIDAFARRCAVITLEFENIPATTIARCARHAPTYPSAELLAIAQDRVREKSTFRQAGLPVTPFIPVGDAESARRAADSLGWPLIVKTARSGYDGKGQYRLQSEADLGSVPWASTDHWIAEQMIEFDREISIIVARTPSGRTATFPLLENDHRNHILDVTRCVAETSPQFAARLREIAIRVAETLGLVGILCVETFARREDVWINEIAPRPHNSGHLTIEACHTSQFEQHLRAICDLPLGDTDLRCGGAAMANLLGDLWGPQGEQPRWDAALSVPGVNLHLYGKDAAKPGRKMGHLTATGNSPEDAIRRVRQARHCLAAAAAKAESCP